jgi:integrase
MEEIAMRRTSYQLGSLKRAKRKKGDVWEYRWREVQIDGSVRRKNIVIGTLDDHPSESAAQAAVDALRLEINKQTPQLLIRNITLGTLANHYQQHELPDIFEKKKPGPDGRDEDRKSYSTQSTYDLYLKNWILPRWQTYRLTEVKAVEVEKWLKGLCFPKTAVPLARGTKAKIRNIMSALFSHAIRWEWSDKNPIHSVRQSAKRQSAPDILSPDEITAILDKLPEPLRTAMELDAFTGLRRGELIGLQWQDIDFTNLVIHVRRSVVQMVDGSTKTEASAKDVPLDVELAESLLRFRQISIYNREADWVFASQRMKGKQPLWPDSLWNRRGKPAVKAAGVTKKVSYHTFRHTFGTLLNANGENPKVVQELLRHATLKVTTDTYLQALSPDKREAQTKLVRLVLRRKATA